MFVNCALYNQHQVKLFTIVLLVTWSQEHLELGIFNKVHENYECCILSQTVSQSRN